MAIEFATCPECRTTLKSTRPAGFPPGEALECPKCGTYFAAEAVAATKPVAAKPVAAAKSRAVEVVDEDEDDRPRKKKPKVRAVEDEDLDEPPRKKSKKSKKRDEGERSYKSSPIRFIILGLLVVIMLVLAFFLYLKWQREKEDNAALPPFPRVAV